MIFKAQLSKNHESLALDDTDYDVRQLKDQLKQLRAEVVHWKAVVNENDDVQTKLQVGHYSNINLYYSDGRFTSTTCCHHRQTSG